jgi:Fe2+ or Zn2+ uptake regulation protein
VYDAIKQTKSHPTADWIFEQVRTDVPKISLGTVYRNLSVLKSEGLIREIFGTDRRAHYEADLSPHAHFICRDCGQIWDVSGVPEVDWRTLKELVGCEVTEQNIDFQGSCAACRLASKDN